MSRLHSSISATVYAFPRHNHYRGQGRDNSRNDKSTTKKTRENIFSLLRSDGKFSHSCYGSMFLHSINLLWFLQYPSFNFSMGTPYVLFWKFFMP